MSQPVRCLHLIGKKVISSRLNVHLLSSSILHAILPQLIVQLHQDTQSTMSSGQVEEAKRLAAYAAIDNHVKSDTSIVGIGSGSTVTYAVDRLAQRVKQESLQIKCIPTSFQARGLIYQHGLQLTSFEEVTRIDVTFDGADEIDKNKTLIKGGGGCLTQEKIVASASESVIIIADDRKDSVNLGDNWTKGVPIEVIPMSYPLIQNRVTNLFGGECQLRMAKAKAGPVVTDNGNFILDWMFDLEKRTEYDWPQIEAVLSNIPGIVESGLFVSMTDTVYIGQSDGTVKRIS